MSNIRITRLWSISDLNLNIDLQLLFQRPRVDARISEYVYEYINAKVLAPKNRMQKGSFNYNLSFGIYNPKKHTIVSKSVYDDAHTIYRSHLYNSRPDYKRIQISCNSTLFNAEMTPKAYATMVYNMFAAFLVEKYKRFDKSMFDDSRINLDWAYIDSFPFPAPFDAQRYLLDEQKIKRTYSDGITYTVEAPVDIRAEYLKHFGF